MIIAVDDPDDPQIAVFRDIRERDLAGRGAGFIAEGIVVLGVLAESPLYDAAAILVARHRLERLAPLISRFASNTPVFSASQAVMDQIAGFPIHRGVLAFGVRTAPLTAPALLGRLGETALVVALIGVANHDNMGGVFRNAAAFGADAVLIDQTCCDPLYRKAIRVSVGAALTVPFARFDAGVDPLAQVVAAGLAPIALSAGAARSLLALEPPERAAIFLGSEGAGLPPSLLERASGVAIEMLSGMDSLNLAAASAIALHHLRFGRERPAP